MTWNQLPRALTIVFMGGSITVGQYVQFYTGMFDFLTRVVHPRLVGPDRVGDSDEFRRHVAVVARRCNARASKHWRKCAGLAC